jgi:hypothetical protein
MTAEAVAQHLRARSVGPGRWMARCPAHEDRAASLSLRERDNGKVLLYCFAGCRTSGVLTAAGLTMRDLFAGGPPPTPEQAARFAKERQERKDLKQQERLAARATYDRLRQLDAVAHELAMRLDICPDALDADALAKLFHSVIEQIRDEELKVGL